MRNSLLQSLQLSTAAFLLGAGLLFVPLTGSAFVYYAESLEGMVVDAQTGKPVEGAIVTANWQLEGGSESGISRGQLEIVETVTDAHGKFLFPAWGPKFSIRWHASFKWPQILIFNPGYKHLRLTNEPRSGSQYTTTSNWHGKTLRISLLSGSTKEFESDRSLLYVSLNFARLGENCEWKRIPRLIAAYNREIAELLARGNRTLLSPMDVFPNEEECGRYVSSSGLVNK
jgi:hypothetical protein